MQRRTIILITGVITILVLMTIAIFAAVGGNRLTLKAEPNISKVAINGTEQDFTQGMKIDYKEATTIEVKQDGYDAFKVTLDPAKDAIKEYTIKLTKTSNSPVGSENYELLQAAEATDDDLGIVSNNQLDVDIKEKRPFSNNYTLYVITTLDGDSDRALVITQKQPDGSTQIVLGPGTQFDQSDLFGLPDDLVTYLKSIGVGEAQ